MISDEDLTEPKPDYVDEHYVRESEDFEGLYGSVMRYMEDTRDPY